MRRQLPLILVLLLACSRSQEVSRTSSAANSYIVIGHYASLTGDQATFGQSSENGIKLALSEINARGGVLSKRIRLITEDDQSKPEEAATAVAKLITKDNVLAVLGEAASSCSLAGAPICQANRTPMITPVSTNPEVTKKGDYIFRICFIDPYQGEALAHYIHDQLHLQRAAILVDLKSDYSTGLSQFFERTFTKLGGTIVATARYSNGDSDFRPQLTSIRSSKPEIVFLPGYYTDVGQIVTQARDLGITQPFAGGDGWDSPKLFELGGKSLDGCFYSNHYYAMDPTPAVRQFVTNYKRTYGAVPDAFAALAYDATRVLVAAIADAKRIDRTAVRNAIARTRDFPGVTGSITIGPDRNPTNKRLIVLGVQDGTVSLKGSVEPKV